MPGPIFFGAVRPERGLGAGLVMPFASTPAMAAHLAEISAAVAPGAHAVLVLDQAGWHGAGALVVPDNITLLPLPPYSPGCVLCGGWRTGPRPALGFEPVLWLGARPPSRVEPEQLPGARLCHQSDPADQGQVSWT